MVSVHEYLGYALEVEIGHRVHMRSWYRAHREQYPWHDFEKDNDRELRLLIRVRRIGIRAERIGRLRLDRVMAAAHEAAEREEGPAPYDVPLADPGDHFVGMPG